MTPDERQRLDAAEAERHNLIAQATRQHLSNLASESRRFERDLEEIEHVYKIRTGQEV